MCYIYDTISHSDMRRLYINPVFDYFVLCDQALQAPACHENMIKVGGYILGEFGNLIAGDPRSRYAIISRSDYFTIARTCTNCPNILRFNVYILFPFPFQSFSPIPITPFQVPPVFRSNASPDSLYLRQVYQPVPRDQATDPADPVLR